MAKNTNPRQTKRSRISDKFVGLMALPLLIALLVAAFSGGESASYEPSESAEEAAVAAEEQQDDRLVVILVDSLRPQLLDEGLMPALDEYSKRDQAVRVALRTCKANFSLPCIQTMMEGRPSPFVAGLHNFTGRSGSGASLPGMLDAGGHQVAMLSDHTLDSLYANHAETSIDVQSWKASYLERDLRAIERSRELLADESLDALLLHLVGTDKSAHKDNPGSPAYEKHFSTVDTAIAELLEELDLSRDSVLIVGDHGHTELGHHDRDSVAIFAGQRYDALFADLGAEKQIEQIEQVDLLYFMAYPLMAPLPTAYEGEVFAVDEANQQPNDHLAHFQQVQLAHLQAAGVPEELGLSEAVEHLRQAEHDSRFDPIKKYAPLFLLFALFVAQGLSALRRGPVGSDARVLLGLLAAALPVALLTSPERGLWLCLPILLAGGYFAWRRGALRAHILVAALVAAASFTGANASWWTEFFHTTGGFVTATPIFFGGLLTAGALATALFFRKVHLLPAAMLTVAFFSLPSGVYYYQFGQNVLLSGLIGVLPVGLWWLSSRRRRASIGLHKLGRAGWLSVALSVVAAVLLIMQGAGGWEWQSFSANWLRRRPDALSLGLFAGFGIFWAWRCRTTTKRVAVVVFCAFSAIFCVGFAELSAAHFTVSFAPALLFLGFLDVRRRLTDGELTPHPVSEGMLVTALTAASLWVLARGFMLPNVDFSFGLEWFGNVFAQERDLFIATYFATLLKYGLAPVAVMLVLRFETGRAHFRAVMAAVALLFTFKALTLLVQIFAGTALAAEKYHELAISDLLFVYALAITLALAYGAIRMVEWLVDRTGDPDERSR